MPDVPLYGIEYENHTLIFYSYFPPKKMEYTCRITENYTDIIQLSPDNTKKRIAEQYTLFSVFIDRIHAFLNNSLAKLLSFQPSSMDGWDAGLAVITIIVNTIRNELGILVKLNNTLPIIIHRQSTKIITEYGQIENLVGLFKAEIERFFRHCT